MPDVAEIRDYRLVDQHETWTKAGPVVSHLPDNEITTLTERATATVAEPGTLGLWGFATGTWMTATILGGYLPQSYMFSAALIVILFAGVAQFIAGLFAYRRTNALNATAFCCFGAFNATAGAMMLLNATGLISAQNGMHEMLGFLLESFAFIAFVLCAAATSRNVVMVCLLFTLGAGYCLTGVAQFLIAPGATAGLGGIAAAGGACLLASAGLAYYLGMAMIVNSAWRRTLLPVLGEP
ncbi:MAG TPA: GPR1/FUN34/YaaH family transporter [Acetobacteraceae bacterium]|nr:GPR1/FUN34/YaaH family transporter [Acetobacteraceae bacterium]